MNENPYAPPQTYGSSAEAANSTLQITRTTSYVDRLRAYRIMIDGNEVVRIKAGRSVDVPVAPGPHSVIAKLDWGSSPALNLNIAEEETIKLECSSNLTGLRVLLAIIYVFFCQTSI